MDAQKKSWFHTWPALLKKGVGLPPFHPAAMISSRVFPSSSVPLIWPFRLVTYAWWCLPQCSSMVVLEILGSRASWGGVSGVSGKKWAS